MRLKGLSVSVEKMTIFPFNLKKDKTLFKGNNVTSIKTKKPFN